MVDTVLMPLAILSVAAEQALSASCVILKLMNVITCLVQMVEPVSTRLMIFDVNVLQVLLAKIVGSTLMNVKVDHVKMVQRVLILLMITLVNVHLDLRERTALKDQIQKEMLQQQQQHLLL